MITLNMTRSQNMGRTITMDKIKNKKLFVLVSALVIVLDCTIDILLLRAFWKKSEE